MKKLFLAVMACAALCACSNDDIVVSSSSVAAEGDGVAYLTVKISDVGGTTRGTDGGYKYGTTAEQTVNDAYFYLYDNAGNYLAKGSADLSNGTAAGTAGDSGDTVEWNSETVVAMWGLTYADIIAGTKLLTVLNKPSGIDLSNKSFDDAVALLAGTPYANDDGSFVMSTSVYYDDGTSTLCNYTAVAAGNFAPEPVDISGDYTNGSYTPVEVYVERLAAKVGVTIDSSIAEGVAVPTDQFLVGGADNLKIYLLGWNVDAIARDAYIVKHIDSNWASGEPFTGWNAASDHRSYWAMSPNYDASAELYPYSSNGNTDADEANATTWLNDYVAYTSLSDDNVVAFDSYVYCGENAISPTVLNDVDTESYAYNGLNAATMVTVKAQIQDENGEGVDIVKWHGEYLPLDTFLADMITEVETYDFEELLEQVAAALEEQYTSYGSVIDILVGYLEPAIYYKENNEFKPFDSSFIYLMNEGDGNFSFWFNSSPSHDTSDEAKTHDDHSESGNAIPDYYIDGKDIVKEAAKDMDDYNFYVKFNDAVKDETVLNLILAILEAGEMIESGAEAEQDGTSYFFNLAEIQISSRYDWTHETEMYYYDGKNFLIRAIDREAAGILDDWAETGYPQLYNSGMMYYYVPIEHLGSATNQGTIGEGQYGVVRNHWYDITITSVSDLGHPIAYENEVIVPTPDIDYYYLGANVNILSWKNITQSVAF